MGYFACSKSELCSTFDVLIGLFVTEWGYKCITLCDFQKFIFQGRQSRYSFTLLHMCLCLSLCPCLCLILCLVSLQEPRPSDHYNFCHEKNMISINPIQYIPRNIHTVFALLCFVVVIHWLISPYPSGLLHWHCGNLTIAPVSAKQPWWIWINTSCEFIMNDCITTTKQSTTTPCAYFLGYNVYVVLRMNIAYRPEDCHHI